MGVKEYQTPNVVVRFDAKRCIHAAECVHGLPAVFDAHRRPWIVPDAASTDEVTTTIERCPSGALTYQRIDGGPAEVPPAPRIIEVENGPLYVQGCLVVRDAEGADVEVGPRAALCRCGASANKPFCDNSHLDTGFRSR